MPTPPRSHAALTLPFLLLTLAAGAGAAQAPPVLIAIDSSRSLTTAESRGAADLARSLFDRLPGEARPALLAFDDEVRWLVRPGGSGAAEALAALAPAGRFTVLNDGLVEGVRALGEGGVLVLVSDGRDENSATTLEDVARLAGERRIRIVTVAAGRADERLLRRLALLTGGRHFGPLAGADPDALAAEVESLRRAAAAAAPAPTPSPAAAIARPAPAAAPSPAVSQGLGGRWLLLLGGLLAVAGVLIGVLLARRRSPSAAPEAERDEPDLGTAPGVPLPPPPATPGPPPVDEIRIARLRGRPLVPPGGLFEVSLDDTANFQRLPFSESIERTLVLSEEMVLSVREPGREPRYYRLPPDRAVGIGRDSKRNTLAFQDPTLSGEHLRLALDEDEAFVVDLGSTNGVIVRERRVDAARLEPGDRFRAGMLELELHVHRASLA